MEGVNLNAEWGIFRLIIFWNLDYGPLCQCVNENSPYSILDNNWTALPAFHAIKSIPK